MNDLKKFKKDLNDAHIKCDIKAIKHDNKIVDKVHGKFKNQRRLLNFFYNDDRLVFAFSKTLDKKSFARNYTVSFSLKHNKLQMYYNKQNFTRHHKLFIDALDKFLATIVRCKLQISGIEDENATKAVVARNLQWKIYKLMTIFCATKNIGFSKIKKKELNTSKFLEVLKDTSYPGLKHINVSYNDVPRYLSRELSNPNLSQKQIYNKLCHKHLVDYVLQRMHQEPRSGSLYSNLRVFGKQLDKKEIDWLIDNSPRSDMMFQNTRIEDLRLIMRVFKKLDYLKITGISIIQTKVGNLLRDVYWEYRGLDNLKVFSDKLKRKLHRFILVKRLKEIIDEKEGKKAISKIKRAI